MSKALLGCVLFCMAASVGGSEGAQTSVVVFALTLAAVTCVRLAHALVCVYYDWRVEHDQVPLSAVWSHVPGELRKTTRSFATVEDLKDVASQRDEDGDVDSVLGEVAPAHPSTSELELDMLSSSSDPTQSNESASTSPENDLTTPTPHEATPSLSPSRSTSITGSSTTTSLSFSSINGSDGHGNASDTDDADDDLL